MTEPTGPERPEKERRGDPPGGADLEARWEEALHGRASDEEASAVQREVAESPRRAEFEAQAEVYAAVRAHAKRREAPAGLRARLRGLAARGGPSAQKRRRVIWAAVGALAAAVILAVAIPGWREPDVRERKLFALLAEEARAEYRRAMLDPRPVQTGSKELGKILGWFEPRVDFRPRVHFAGGGGTVLEGGRIGYVSGIKVPGLLYRWRGKPLVLVIFPARGNPEWSRLPRKKWVAMTGEGPTAAVWRRGDYIYAVVGDAPADKLREISRAVTPKGKKF
ncbi:MAG: hypothetical protein V3V62_13130 [bacterium]